MNKLTILLILVLGIGINGCEESVKIEDLSKAHLDQDFKSFMTNSENLKSRFLKANQTEKAIETFRLAVENSDVQKISEKLNFNSIQELEKFGSDQKATFDRFIAKYPSLIAEKRLNIEKFRLIVVTFIKESNQNSDQSLSGRIKGCVNGTCLQQMNLCYQDSQVSLSVALATCFSTLYWFPPYWALCTGSAFAMNAGDNLNCIRFYDDCCAP